MFFKSARYQHAKLRESVMLRRKGPPGEDRARPSAFHGQASVHLSSDRTGGHRTCAVIGHSGGWYHAHFISGPHSSILQALALSGLKDMTADNLVMALEALGLSLLQCIQSDPSEDRTQTLKDIETICETTKRQAGDDCPHLILNSLRKLIAQLGDRLPRHRKVLEECLDQLASPPVNEYQI